MPNPDGSLTVAEQLQDLKRLVEAVYARLDELVSKRAFDQLAQRVEEIRDHGSIQAQEALRRTIALEQKTTALEFRAARYPDADITAQTQEWEKWRDDVDKQLVGIAEVAKFKRWLVGIVMAEAFQLLGIAVGFYVALRPR